MLLLYILVYAKLKLRCTLYLWTRASTSESRGVFGCHSGENYVKWNVDEPSNKNNASDQRVDTVRCDIGPERRRYSARVSPRAKTGKIGPRRNIFGLKRTTVRFFARNPTAEPRPAKNDASPYILHVDRCLRRCSIFSHFFFRPSKKELGEHAGDHVATAEHDVA